MLFRVTAPAIPIVPMKEVKPDLSAAATVEQQELPPAAVTELKQEVEQTPSGKKYISINLRPVYSEVNYSE